MSLSIKTHDQLVSDIVAAWAAELKLDPSLRSGDAFLAIANSMSSQMMWEQSMIAFVNAFARASTCMGSDLDSWMAQFGFARLPASKGSGDVTLSLFQVRTTEVLITPETVIQTTSGDIQYKVIADAQKGAWDANRNAYVLTPGQTSILAKVEALVAGVASNVQANQLVQFVSSVAGPDKVTNDQPITNGADQEADDSYRERFILSINSRSLGTIDALKTAILNLRANLQVLVIENEDINGEPLLGAVTIVLDDGSGAPSEGLLDLAQDAVEVVRPASIEVTVVPPNKVDVDIELNIKIDSFYLESDVQLAVQSAIVNYVNQLPIGATLYLSKLVGIALTAHPGVIAIQPNSVQIDNLEADKTILGRQVLKTVAADVAIGTY